MKKLCTGCNRYRALRFFRKAAPDFPTRDGLNFKCNDCAPPWRLVRDPITKKVRFTDQE